MTDTTVYCCIRGRESEALFDGLVGNERLKNMLAHEIERGSLAHAYIIEGRAGSGKHTLSLELAAALAGTDEEGKCRMKEGRCPDIRVVGKPDGRKTIGVETVRDIGYQASVTPNEFDFKLTVIEDADAMTAQAQNAFLKLLEEPPAGAYFLMLCENSAALLPTIRSRASVLRMERCETEEMDEWLERNSRSAAALKAKDRHAYDRVLRASDGCIGAALSLLGSGISDRVSGAAFGKSAVKKASELVECVARRRTVPLVTHVCTLGNDRGELCSVLSSFTAAIRDMVLCKAHMRREDLLFSEGRETEELSADKLCFYDDTEEVSVIAGALSLSELCEMADAAADASERIQKNGNIRQILTELGYRLKTIVC